MCPTERVQRAKTVMTRERKKKKKGKNEESEKWDWLYNYRSKDIIRIALMTRISSFPEKQYLKYIAHITRLENNSATLPPAWICNQWNTISKIRGIKAMQLRKIMYNNNYFNR